MQLEQPVKVLQFPVGGTHWGADVWVVLPPPHPAPPVAMHVCTPAALVHCSHPVVVTHALQLPAYCVQLTGQAVVYVAPPQVAPDTWQVAPPGPTPPPVQYWQPPAATHVLQVSSAEQVH